MVNYIERIGGLVEKSKQESSRITSSLNKSSEPHPALSLAAKSAHDMVKSSINRQEQNYMQSVEDIRSMNLGEAETIKRETELSQKTGFFVGESPTIQQHKKSLRTRKENFPNTIQGSSDRMLEEEILKQMHSLKNTSDTFEQYAEQHNALNESLIPALQTGTSSRYLAQSDAQLRAAEITIPTMARVQQGATDLKSIGINRANSLYKELKDHVISQSRFSPTSGELDMYISEVSKYLDPYPIHIQNEIKQYALFGVLDNDADQALLAHATVKYKEYISPDRASNLSASSLKRDALRIGAPVPLTEYEQKVQAQNVIGKWVEIDPGIGLNQGIRAGNNILKGAAIEKQSPEMIRQSILGASKGSIYDFDVNQGLFDNIATQFEIDFTEDLIKAAEERGVASPNSIPKMTALVYDPQGVDILNLRDWTSRFQRRLDQVHNLKNIVYHGTDAIQHVFQAEEREAISKDLNLMNGDQQWQLLNTIKKSLLDKNGQLTEGMTPFDPGLILGSLTQDKLLTNMIVLGGDIPQARSLHGILRLERNRDPKTFGEYRAAASQALAIELNDTSLVPESTREAASDYALALMVRSGAQIPAAKEKGAARRVQIGERLNIWRKGISTEVIVQKGNIEALKNTVKNTRLQLTINEKQYDYTLEYLLDNGFARIENKPGSLNEFYIEVAQDEKSAAARIFTRRPETIKIQSNLDKTWKKK